VAEDLSVGIDDDDRMRPSIGQADAALRPTALSDDYKISASRKRKNGRDPKAPAKVMGGIR
jgi:hypothetical protein